MTLAINDVCEVIQAVRTVFDNAAPNDQRKLCTERIEALKEGDPTFSISIAFKLINESDAQLAHVGWNFIEHVIKYKWAEISGELRLYIRNGILEHVSDGKYTLTSSTLNIKTAISRNMVAMMEQEWPQNWPEFFDQLKTIALNPDLFQQSQMVFIILQRLIENVITYGTISSSVRRRDLSMEINRIMPDILEMTIRRIRMCLAAGTDENSILVAKAAILLLSESVDWVVGRVLENYVSDMIEVLCAYLQTAEHNMYEEAAICLWRIASRKRSKNDETPIVVSMFQDAPMQSILSAASLAAAEGPTKPGHYQYLKALCDLLTALGVHLSEVWGYIKNPPPNFSLYLSAISAFFTHPSMCIRSEVSQVLVTFASHEAISVTQEYMACATSQLFPHIPKNVEKTCSLDDTESLTGQFAKMDYNDDIELQRDFMQLRDRVCRFAKESLSRHMNFFVMQLQHWVTRVVGNTDAIPISEWEAMKRYLMSLINGAYSQGLVTSEIDATFVVLFNNLMQRVMEVNSPAVLNAMLSIPSSFIPVFEQHVELVPFFFSKLKDILLIDVADGEVISLKRHAISLMIKVASTMPNVIKPHAEFVFEIVNLAAPCVTVMQRANLVQVLGCLTNLVPKENQQFFLRSAIQANIDFISSEAFVRAISAPEFFLAFIGLTSPPSESSDESSIYFANRLKVKAHLCSLDGILQQVKPASPQESNPLFDLLAPIFPQFFQFAQCLNALLKPENMRLVNRGFEPTVCDISALDKHTIYCTVMEAESNDGPEGNSVVSANDHLKRFIGDVTDMIQSIIGLCASMMSADFYTVPSIANYLAALVSDAPHIVDFRMRNWIRRTYKPIVCSCPPHFLPTIVPFVTQIVVHLRQRFLDRFNTINEMDMEGEQTKEEIFLEHMTCVMSREYTAFLRFIFLGDSLASKDDNRKSPSEVIHPTGAFFIQDQTIHSNLVVTLCSFLTFRDTQTALRALPIANVVFGTTFDNFTDEMSSFVFIHAIQSLAAHGADEVAVGPLLSIIFLIYTSLRPAHPILFEVLKDIPEATPETLQAFDQRVLSMINTPKLVEKNKRDIMRKLLKPVIATNIGEQYKRPSQLRSLQAMVKAHKFSNDANSSDELNHEWLFSA